MTFLIDIGIICCKSSYNFIYSIYKVEKRFSVFFLNYYFLRSLKKNDTQINQKLALRLLLAAINLHLNFYIRTSIKIYSFQNPLNSKRNIICCP